MTRPRLAPAGKLDQMCAAFCFAIDALQNEPCPKCGQQTLEVEIAPRSGIIITCNGLDPDAEDCGCDFSRFALLAAYRVAVPP